MQAEVVAPPDDYIETISGRKLWLANPVFDPIEIAWSLSFMCRFTGHCKRFYSVGEHSILVADIMRFLNIGDPLEGLLHDGVESVLADVNSPVKYGMLPEYCRVEDYFDLALRKQFFLPHKKTAECKHADWVALAIEAKLLLPTGGKDWAMPDYARPDADRYIAAYRPMLGWESFDSVRTTWLHLYKTLVSKRK